MNESALLFLLLPIAALTGWAVGRGLPIGGRRNRSTLTSQYFRGLNYLLNEESDKAIEAFLKLAEINHDTVDTHLALGTLFRRRGELDKAIRYHKHIITRPNLSNEQRERVLFELALDYMRAGLLDRAERLFLDLKDSTRVGAAARGELLDIYQQTKDWARAIEQAQGLDSSCDHSNERLIAQLYCELAQSALESADADSARAHLRQVRRYDPGNARARLIEARLAMSSMQYEVAAGCFREACELDPELVVSHFTELQSAHQLAELADVLMNWLQALHKRSGVFAPALAWARLQAETEPRAAADYLLDRLEQRPTVRGLELLMRLRSEHGARLDEVKPELIQDLMQRLIQDQPVYRCRQCGFSGTTYHWHCPSCRSWSSTRLIRGVMGD
jgi:lipopolysaccharide biosynthesis regulator YciM